jgi:hypothetical protein
MANPARCKLMRKYCIIIPLIIIILVEALGYLVHRIVQTNEAMSQLKQKGILSKQIILYVVDIQLCV